MSFVAFDLLYIDGHLLLDDSYDERRARLEALQLGGDTFTTTESFRDVSGKEILQAATANGLEGVVAKRRDARYRPGRRSPDWVKVKSFRAQEVVIGGWTEGRGERDGSLGALLLGVPGPDGLRYAGKVGTGFSERARRDLLDDLRPLAATASPFDSPLPARETSTRTSCDLPWSARWRTASGHRRDDFAIRCGVACDPTKNQMRWSWNESRQ